MDELIRLLVKKDIISKEKAAQIEEHERQKPLSVFWELRTLLYLGIS